MPHAILMAPPPILPQDADRHRDALVRIVALEMDNAPTLFLFALALRQIAADALRRETVTA